MKALIINQHRMHLINILIDIYKDSFLSSALGFKGGTAAMLFYDLPRFSVDLDFDLIQNFAKDSDQIDTLIKRLTTLLTVKYKIKDQSKKYNTLFWLVDYQSGLSNIKIEISTRKNPYNHYHQKSFYGVKIKVMAFEDMIAHKMVALISRKNLANRDLFDLHFFLSSHPAPDINYQIIKEKTGKKPREFYLQLYDFVDKIDPKSVLFGLGELLTEKQKNWAKNHLIKELKNLIKLHINHLS